MKNTLRIISGIGFLVSVYWSFETKHSFASIISILTFLGLFLGASIAKSNKITIDGSKNKVIQDGGNSGKSSKDNTIKIKGDEHDIKQDVRNQG